MSRIRTGKPNSDAFHRLYFGTKSSNLVSRFIMDIPENLADTKTPSVLYQDQFLDDVSVNRDEDEWLND